MEAVESGGGGLAMWRSSGRASDQRRPSRRPNDDGREPTPRVASHRPRVPARHWRGAADEAALPNISATLLPPSSVPA